MRPPRNSRKRGRVVAADGTVTYELEAGRGHSASWVTVQGPAFRRQRVSGSKAVIRDLQSAGLIPR